MRVTKPTAPVPSLTQTGTGLSQTRMVWGQGDVGRRAQGRTARKGVQLGGGAGEFSGVHIQGRE